ncbi:hypothetical protein [Gracilinema caldarium]|uniref:Uncharacterized protein n=1 Tax=Gracilinema caldarium (strain ATCC 51460 / DSM 7334 / H1) TaxID=744872 RepID=F8EXQ0_GRAC1|nr:hypothetical protein [Gracilinema caldarium]AEJ19631.1 hypothetical protein Spica_1487 [Gracilinema caldarium DSM 7334]
MLHQRYAIIFFYLYITFFFAFSHNLGAQTQEIHRITVRARQGNQEAQHVANLIQQADQIGLTYELRPLLSQYGSFGTSIQFDFIQDNTDTNNIVILVAVPLSSEFAVTVVEDLLLEISKNAINANIRIAFVADEANGHRGLIEQLDQFDDPESVVVLYFDLLDETGPLSLYQGSQGYISPLQLLHEAVKIGKKYKIPINIPEPFNELFRLNVLKGNEALEVIHERGFSAIVITNQSPTRTGPLLDKKDVSRFLKDYIEHSPKDTALFDFHYTILHFNNNYFFIDEKHTLIIVLCSVFTILLFFAINSIIFRRKIIIYWVIFLRRSWILLLYIGLLLGSLYLSRICIWIWLMLYGTTTSLPLTVVILFPVLWFSLFSFISPILQNITIPKRSSFYGQSGILVILFGLLLAITIDISFMPVFIWALFWIFLGSLVHNYFINLLSSLLAPVQIIILYILTAVKNNAIYPLYIYPSQFQNSLVLSFIVLPFILLWKRTILLRIQKSKQRLQRNKYGISKAIFTVVLLLVILSIGPTIISTNNKDKDVTTNSDTPLFSTNLSSTSFLNQKTISIMLKAKTTIDRYQIYVLKNDVQNISLIESTIPFAKTETGDLYSDLTGYPDTHFTFDILLPKNEKLSIRIIGKFGHNITEYLLTIP